MGRDVTGIRNDMKPNGVTSDRVHVAPTIATDNVEPEQVLSTADRNFKGEVREVVQENREMPAKGTNFESGVSNGIRAKIEALKPKLSVKASPSLKPSPRSPDVVVSETIKMNTPKAQSSEEVSVPSQSIKISTPKAFSSQEVSTEKVASDVSNASEVETDSSSNSPTSKKNDLHSPRTAKTMQPQPPLMSGKSLQSDTNEKHHDEEDDCSFTSSGGSSLRYAAKFKPTVPVGPNFVCGERVARRKEYYMRLEEKQKALEAERLAEQARMKEEEEAALKKLRKSMSYKANPIPSFYREGPPPKAKLKKVPLTRPKSPNLTRAKSSISAGKSTQDEEISRGDVARHSTGTSPTPKNKNSYGSKHGFKKVGVRVGQEKDTTITPPSEEEQIDSNKCVAEGNNAFPRAEHSPMPSIVNGEDATKA